MRKDNAFKGYETWLTTVKMNIKMYLHLALFLLVVQAAISVWMSWHWYGEIWRSLASYVYNSISIFRVPDGALGYTKRLLIESEWIFLTSSSIWLSYPFLVGLFKTRAKRQSGDQYVRGARLIEPRELKKEIKRDREDADIPLGPVKIPRSAEVKHFFIVGRPGVGKTVAMSQVIDRRKKRDSKGIIYDFKGDYTSRFYDPDRDILFNPLDARSKGWTLFNEVQNFMDIDAIAHSLIPPAYQSDPFWNDAGRDVFSGILHYLYQHTTVRLLTE